MSLDVLLQRRGQRAVRIGRSCMSDEWHEVYDSLDLAAREGTPTIMIEGWGGPFLTLHPTPAQRKQYRDYVRALNRWCKVYPGEEAERLLPYIADDLDGLARWFRPELLAGEWDWIWISW